MRFDLSDLRLIVNVDEHSSISLGASAVNISAAAASERIKSMELELGTSLLNREAKGVRTTPAGLALVRHARLMLAQNERMRNELSEFSEGLRGRIRILSNTAGLSEILPKLMARYLIDNPSVDLEIEERQSHEIIEAVGSGERDAGIVADFTSPGNLELYHLAMDQLVLVVPKDHLFAPLTQIAFSRVLTSELVGLLSSSALTGHLEMQASRVGQHIRWRVQVPNYLAVCGMVAMNVGPGIVSESAARRASKTLPLAIVKLTDPWATRKLSLCVHKNSPRPLYLEKLITYTQANVKKQLATNASR